MGPLKSFTEVNEALNKLQSNHDALLNPIHISQNLSDCKQALKHVDGRKACNNKVKKCCEEGLLNSQEEAHDTEMNMLKDCETDEEEHFWL